MLRVRVTVRAKTSDGNIGAPINLTGAAMTAATGIPDQPGTAGTVVPIDLVDGVVDVAFPAAGNVASSFVLAQLKVVRSGEAQITCSASYNLQSSVV